MLRVVVSLAVALAWLGEANAARDVDYVDSKLCATCHRSIYDNYVQTGMGRSFSRVSSAAESSGTVPDYYHDRSDAHFSIFRRGADLIQRRWQTGFDGKETNVEELKIDYILGSGNHARTYLHRTDRGTLIELPLGWYSEKGGNWAMSPGSDSAHPQTRRFISYRCMFCHNAIPRIPAANEAPGSDPVFTGELPLGIDCQRCHGPGGKHMQTVSTPRASREAIRASIVNPARLDSKLRMDVCLQCHLETTSSRIPATIVRFDRGPFSFIPGEPRENFMLAFDHAPGTGHGDKFESLSSAYRLRQSQCFLKSQGGLTCDTCHNPHQIPRGAEAVSHYSNICRQCHGQNIDRLVAGGQHTAAPDCAGCHMPKRRAEDSPGVVMTDHLIQRRPPPGNLLAEFREGPAAEYHGEVVPYYPSPLPDTPESALYRAVAQVGLGNNTETGLPDLAREVAKQKPAQAEFYIVLGDAWHLAGKNAEAVEAYGQALRISPDSPRILRSMAAALIASHEDSRAEETLRRALTVAPDDAVSWYRAGMLDSQLGRLAQAAEKIRKAIALDPTLPDQSRGLGDVLLRAGQSGEAEDALREALRTDPWDDDAWDLLGRALTGKGAMPEASFDFARAIRLRPGDGLHNYDYALALVRMDRFDDAQTQADAAVSANPDLAEAHELLGGLFERRGDSAQAAREYRTTLQLQPGRDRAHLRLGIVSMEQGDSATAAKELREAAQSSDPSIARQAAEALARLKPL